MMNFDDADGTTATVSVSAPSIRETVTFRPAPKTFLVSGDWTWRQLRDYIEVQTSSRFDMKDDRDPAVIAGICKSFISRWGGKRAEEIARYAYERKGGVWLSKPVGFSRFTKNSDPYFAEVIVREMRDNLTITN